MKDFVPEEHGLLKSFRLTNFTGLKGWGCKVPQEKLLKLLKNLAPPKTPNQNCGNCEKITSENEIGIGLDACLQVNYWEISRPNFYDQNFSQNHQSNATNNGIIESQSFSIETFHSGIWLKILGKILVIKFWPLNLGRGLPSNAP